MGNPGELVATESALAHHAREKGANTALAATAEDTAEVLGTTRSPARTWLKVHDASAWFADRQTANVWTSCDGTAAVSTGLWRGGWFATVWKRQKKLDFKWLLTDAGPLATDPPPVDWVTGKVADCPPRGEAGQSGPPMLPPLPAPMPPPNTPAGADNRDGRSNDGSLVWRSSVLPDGAHALHVWLWQDGALHAVFDRVTPASH